MLKVVIEDDLYGMLLLCFFYFCVQQVVQFVVGVWVCCYGMVKLGQFGLEIVYFSYCVLGSYEDDELGDCFDLVYLVVEGVGLVMMCWFIGLVLDCLFDEVVLELFLFDWLFGLGLLLLCVVLLIVYCFLLDVDLVVLVVGCYLV